MNKKVILCILDGFGIDKSLKNNPIDEANTKTLDYLFNTYPNTLIEASGSHVGLPQGIMGNSEVGHLNIGAGRIIKQPLVLINEIMKTNQYKNNSNLKKIIKDVNKTNKNLHLFILLSDGGVHSDQKHLYETLKILKENKVKKVYLHLFLDGRDTLPNSSSKYIKKLTNFIKTYKIGFIASISGRYYAMDRDSNFDRNLAWYDCVVTNKIENTFTDPFKYITNEYRRMKLEKTSASDEFVKPATLLSLEGIFNEGDNLLFLNYRADRLRQLTNIFINPSKYEQTSHLEKINNLKLYSLLEYEKNNKVTPLFNFDNPKKTLGEILSKKSKNQLRIAETEKYAHVTYFFDGSKNYDGIELKELKNTKRILIPSPKVKTYDLKPEMSIREIMKALNDELEENEYDFVLVNFANCDMVGHTTIHDACVEAINEVDKNVKKLYELAKLKGYVLLVTADHGNIEKIIDEEGNPFSAHTTSKVPFIICDNSYELEKGGRLSNIAPSILEILNIKKPKEMSENSLIKERKTENE